MKGESLTVALMARLEMARVAERLKEARLRAGLTQEELANVIEVHKHTVENIENNRLIKGPYQYVNAWAGATSTSVEWILHGQERSTVVGEGASGEAILAAVEGLHHRLDVIEEKLRSVPDDVARRRASERPG